MRKYFCFILTIFFSLGNISCCFLPYPIKTDAYRIYSSNENVHVSNAYVRKHPLGPLFHITLHIDSDTAFYLNKNDLIINYGSEETTDIRIAGTMEFKESIQEFIDNNGTYSQQSKMKSVQRFISTLELADMNGFAMYSHSDSLLINKGSNIIDIFVDIHHHRFKETVTCTFRPRWASEERKLLEIYPKKVVRRMRKEGMN